MRKRNAEATPCGQKHIASVKEIVSTPERLKKATERPRATKRTPKVLALSQFVLFLGILGATYWMLPPTVGTPIPGGSSSLDELLRSPPEKLLNVTIIRANLLCTESLYSQNPLEALAAEGLIRTWAQHVKTETDRHWYRYRQNPTEYDSSPGFFRMLMMSVVLAEDYGIHYDPSRMGSPGTAQEHDGFFSDPDSVFLTGLLGSERKGTCSSMPVLYVAMGRELGYPLSLVSTKGHLFVRWEGDGERFNVEVTGHGLNRFDDDYYRHWPFEITPAEEQVEGYLKSLTRAEEVAAFLSIRGMCLSEVGKTQQAAEAFGAAARLAPNCASYKKMLVNLQSATKSLVQTQFAK